MAKPLPHLAKEGPPVLPSTLLASRIQGFGGLGTKGLSSGVLGFFGMLYIGLGRRVIWFWV